MLSHSPHSGLSGLSFRALAEHLPDVVFRYRVRPERRFEYVSGAATTVLGCTPDELYADPGLIMRIVHPDDAVQVRAVLADPSRWEVPLVCRFIHRDGRTVWLETHQVRAPDDDGVVEGVGRDITLLRETQRERERLLAALEQAAEVVIITDAQGTIEYVNRGFEQITGYTREEAVGRNPRMLKSGLLPPEYYEAMWRRLAAGEQIRHAITNRCKDGALYECDCVISPVRDERGRATHFISLQRDVTNERRLDEQLRHAQKMEAIGQLTGGIAHDFNNLLTIVLGNIAMIRDRLPPGYGDVEAHLADVERTAHAGASMVGKLLAFGRREHLTLTAVDVSGMMDDFVGRSLRRLLPESIDVRVTCPEDVPPVCADRNALEQILINLATNARDAMQGRGALEIGVSETSLTAEDRGTVPVPHPGRYVCISVSDSGGGMDAATASRAFEPFFTTKGPGHGTGLGLSMVDGLIRQQRGALHLYSEVGHGTTIRLYLPVSREAAQALTAPAPADREPVRGQDELILLVEDEPSLRVLASRILGRYGYRVVLAENGVAALSVYERQGGDVALILSDLVMPKMGGIELFTELRRRGCAAPFLLATGYGTERGKTEALRVPVVPKPWTVHELLGAVRRALSATPAAATV